MVAGSPAAVRAVVKLKPEGAAAALIGFLPLACLVAHHSEARFEAEERELIESLLRFCHLRGLITGELATAA